MNECKNCHKTLDAHTGIDPKASDTPEVGDLSICAYCGAISQFDTELNLVPLSKEELEQIKEEDYKAWEMMNSTSNIIKNIRKLVN